MDVPRPGERPDQKREKEEGQHEGLAEGKDADHEDEKHDDAPDQADEGDWPGLSLGFVRLIKDFRGRMRTAARRHDMSLTKKKLVLVYDIGNPEVNRSKDDNQRLDNAV